MPKRGSSMRMNFVLAGTLGALLLGAPSATRGADSLADTIRDAAVWAFPVYEMMRLRWQTGENPHNPNRIDVGAIRHSRRLADHTARTVTTPNNDTVYSLAWLDLSVSPVRVRMPDTDGRYHSLALIDVYTNNVASIGRRTIGTRAAEFVVVGPDWRGALPVNLRVIRATTNDALVLARIVVKGVEDLPAVRTLQDGITLEPLDPRARTQRPAGIAPTPGDPENFVKIVNQALGLNPIAAYERERVAGFAAVGLRPGDTDAWSRLPNAVQEAWRREFPSVLASLRRVSGHRGVVVDGWRYPSPNMGQFGTDYEYRAAIALTGLLALEPVEALYASAGADAHGARLTGGDRYRLRIPPGGVPVDAFWSLSMYEVMPDGRLFFTANPIARYAIGDRTRGLVRNSDGSIDIWIQHATPAADHLSNWLPAPAGEFRLIMRAYQPKPVLLDGRFRLPPVDRLP